MQVILTFLATDSASGADLRIQQAAFFVFLATAAGAGIVAADFRLLVFHSLLLDRGLPTIAA